MVDGEEQLARLMAYVHNNPVRAGVVSSPEESDWTSHCPYLTGKCTPGWLDVEWTLAAMGYASSSSGRLAFHDYAASRATLPRDPLLAGPGSVETNTTQRLLSVVSTITGVPEKEVLTPGSSDRAIRAAALLLHLARDVFGVPADPACREQSGVGGYVVSHLKLAS